MRPCQQCNAPVEPHQRSCPVCGAKQVSTVGFDAPPLAAPEHLSDEAFEEEAPFRGMVQTGILIAAVIVPLFGWLGGGVVGLVLSCVTLLIFIVAALQAGGMS